MTDKLINDFYKVVNCMLENIISSQIMNDLLFQCRYITYYQLNKKINFNDNTKYPLIFCLGGMGYQIYYQIINKYYQNIHLESKTEDYDFSFSLVDNSDKNINLIKNEIIEIYNKCIKNYRYEPDDKKKYFVINKTNFNIESENKKDRLQIKINCQIGNRIFHILELCFWYSGKISDSFTVNDFKKDKLFMYVNKDGYCFYLLPLEKLIKTTYYAILDNYERQNYSKCIKYLDRIRYIKLTFDEYNKSDNKQIELLNYIYQKYFREIYHKYKIMFDYPYINSKILTNINDKEVVKCVIRETRTNTHKTYVNNINNFIETCNKKEDKLKYDVITDEDTEKDLTNNYEKKYLKYKLKYFKLKNTSSI